MNKIILSTILGLSILLTSVIPTKAFTIDAEDTATVSKIVELNSMFVSFNLVLFGQRTDLRLNEVNEQKDEPSVQPPEEKKEEQLIEVESDQPEYYEMTVTATAYTAYCKGCSGITKTGINLRSNPSKKVIAVDPKVIPLGTTVWVEGYGKAIAGDTGGAIKGKKIDVFIPKKTDAYTWGRKQVKIKVYN